MTKKSTTREARLAAALRENLKRRKAAERARREAVEEQAEPAAADRPNPAPKDD